MVATSSEVWRRPPSRRGGIGGSGSKPIPVRPGCDLLRASRLGCGATKFLVIAQVPISATVIGILARNCVLGCLGCWSQIARVGVPNLCQVVGWEGRSRSSLKHLLVGEGRPCAVDAPSEERLLANVTVAEQAGSGSDVWSCPPGRRGGTRGSRPRPRAPTSSPPAGSLACLPSRPWCVKRAVIAQVPISATLIGIYSGNCTLDRLLRRSVGLYPAFRAA